MKKSNPAIGAILRSYRTSRKYTLQKLAEKAGVTASYLSQLENNKLSPSLNTLQKLADILMVPFTAFFTSTTASSPIISNPEDWNPLTLTAPIEPHGNAEILHMVSRTENKKMQPFFTTLSAGRKNCAVCNGSSLEEEFIYVLQGTLTVEFQQQNTQIPEGSSAYFPPGVAYALYNNSEKQECRLILVRCAS